MGYGLKGYGLGGYGISDPLIEVQLLETPLVNDSDIKQFDKPLNQAVQATDFSTVEAQLFKQLNQETGVADDAQKLLRKTRSEELTLQEALRITAKLSRQEDVPVNDAAEKLAGINFAASVNLFDASAVKTFKRRVQLFGLEAAQRKELGKTVSAQTNVSATLFKEAQLSRNLSVLARLVDSDIKTVDQQLVQPASVQDETFKQFSTSRVEAVDASDAAATLTGKNVNEALDASTVLEKLVGKLVDQALTVSAGTVKQVQAVKTADLSVADAVKIEADLFRALKEAATVTSQLRKAVGKIVQESANPDAVLTDVADLTRSFVEQASVLQKP